MTIQPGLSARATHRVDTISLADQWGGQAHALASPIMIIFIEQTCMKATDHLQHLAPTPPEWEVTVDAELIEVDGRMMTYRISVRDAVGVVGEGIHTRCAVSSAGFHQRLSERRDSAALAQ